MTNLASRLRRLLDPWQGDTPERPGRDIRLGLRRVELAAITMAADAAVEGIFSVFRQSAGLGVLAIFAIVGAIIFAAVARRGQRRDVPAPARLSEAFIVYALLCSQGAGYFISLGGRIPTGYAMVFLAAAVFFLIPPRRFAVIGAGTFALFVAWVLSLEAAFFDKVVVIFNTGLAVLAGCFGRLALDRMQQTDRRQRARIAEQNMALVEANRMLALRNAELGDLMAIAAHDLRSPLLGIGNLLDLAAERSSSAPEVLPRMLRETRESVAAMLSLIGRLLDAHEAEDAEIYLLAPVVLQSALGAAARRMSQLAQGHGVALVLETAGPEIPARANPDALEQILDNLISNAVRFSPWGCSVRLVAGIDAGPFIEVMDTGIGIPPEERGRLFGKFHKGASRPVHGARGSGLGLYIARLLAEGMEARVSYRPGRSKGSVFRIDFGAARAEDGDQPLKVPATRPAARTTCGAWTHGLEL